MINTHMQNLSKTHRRPSAILLHQLIRIIQRPARPDDDLHAALFRQAHHLRISLPGIRIRVFLEHEMGDLPRLE